MSGAGRLRAFIALVFDASVRERLARVCDELRPAFPDARWVGANQLHLTLRFLGDVDALGLKDLAARLRGPASGCRAARVALGPLGMFPPKGAPRVLWLGVALSHELLVLQKVCEREAVAIGLPPEPRAYRPHVTLARWRGRARRRELPEVDFGRARLDRIVLFESRLAPSGAAHTPLAEYEFQAEVA